MDSKNKEEKIQITPIGKIIRENNKNYLLIFEKYRNALKELDKFSHVWVLWWINENANPESRKHLVSEAKPHRDRPEIGIFANLSPYRPNPVGLTAVKLLNFNIEKGRVEIEGIDAFDDSPIIDIKPYISSSHRIMKIKQPIYHMESTRSFDDEEVEKNRSERNERAKHREFISY